MRQAVYKHIDRCSPRRDFKARTGRSRMLSDDLFRKNKRGTKRRPFLIVDADGVELGRCEDRESAESARKWFGADARVVEESL